MVDWGACHFCMEEPVLPDATSTPAKLLSQRHFGSLSSAGQLLPRPVLPVCAAESQLGVLN